jgi:hypothetical protein
VDGGGARVTSEVTGRRPPQPAGPCSTTHAVAVAVAPSHARACAWRGAPPVAPPRGPSRAAGRGAGGWACARDGRKVDFRSGQRLAGRGTSSRTATRVRGDRDGGRPRVRRWTSKCRSAAGWRLRSPRHPHRRRSATATRWERFRLDDNGFIRFSGLSTGQKNQPVD